jgi:peptide/nickel transport system substrate-binding protein
VGRIRRFLSVPLLMLVVFSIACQPAAAPAAKPAETKPAESKPAAAAPAAQGAATAAPAAAKPGEAAKPAAADAKPTAGGQLKVGINADLTTMDPHVSTAAVDRQIYQSIFDPLVRLDKDLKIQPSLAQSWEQPDPKTLIFKLRTGVKYHDGEPFNAASVKANIERMQSHPKSQRKGELADVASVEAVDESTVKFTLKQPSSPLLSLLTDRAGMMVSTKAAEAAGDDFARKPVGTGAFSFVEWVKDDRLVVKKNPTYWDKDASGTQLPYLDEIQYKPITDGTQRLTALKTGTVDIIDIPASKDMPALKSGQELTYSEIPGLAYRYIQINTKRPVMESKEIRQAIAWAIDREAINKAVFFNVGQPAYQAIPPSSFAFDAGFKANSPRDVNKAKELVAKSGLKDPKFTLVVTNTPEDKQIAEVYKEQLADVGISMDIELLEFATLLDRTLKQEFDASSLQWSGRPDPDGNIYNYFHSKGSGNRSQYSNPEVDKILEQTRAVSDPAERKKLYSQLNQILTDDNPMIYIQHRPEVKVMSSKIKGFVHVPDGMMRFAAVTIAR